MKREQLLSYAYKYKGEFNKIMEAVANNEPWAEVHHNGKFITLVDPEYPDCFRQLTYAPWILFYEGNLDLLNKPTLCFSCPKIAITPVTTKVIKKLQSTMTEDKVICASLLEHCDYLMQNMKSPLITFLGTGLDVSYPKRTKELQAETMKTSLVMSEYPPGVQPFAHHYPWAQRLYAAISDVLLVPEALPRSSVMLLCSDMEELQKPIYTMFQTRGKQFEGMKELLKFDTEILTFVDNIEGVVNRLDREQNIDFEYVRSQ